MSPEDMEHVKVLRLRPNELFVVCDGTGFDYVCRLEDPSSNVAVITDTLPSLGEPSVSCSVYIAYAKGDKMEYAVQKSVELGAREIVLYPSARSISIPKDLEKRTARLQRIALEAAKQSGRGLVPAVTVADSFNKAIEDAANSAIPLFLYENEKKTDLRQALEMRIDALSVSIVAGPEGGFEASEADFARSLGMISVSLGPRILRCETAPIAALAAVMYHTGNL